MLAKELFDLRVELQRKGIMFCFSGFMTEEVLTGISIALKRKMELESVDRRTTRGLFSIFVELVQNVIRYSAEQNTVPRLNEEMTENYDLRFGVLAVGHDLKRGYFVACGNLVTDQDAERLDRDLSHIANLDQEELKALYKQILRGSIPQGSKGAGVGFVEIARRATNGFEYDFHPSDNQHQFFSLMAYL
jgi:hypothetical protein